VDIVDTVLVVSIVQFMIRHMGSRPASTGGYSDRFQPRDTASTVALAKNVRRLRKAKGWSQGQLAKTVGIQLAAVSHIENCRGNPTLTTQAV
jgi:DNA-binding XRE family transcriptional regulator